MKQCGKCSQVKSLAEFSYRNKAKGTYNTWCKACMSSYDRTRYTTTDRPAQVRENYEALRKRNIEWIEEYLADKSCVDCGITDRRVFQLDHRDRSTKTANVSQLVQNSSLERLASEVAKCDVRCANCHQIKTGEQFGWRTSFLALGKKQSAGFGP